MKKLLLFLIVASAALGCKKKEEAADIPSAPTVISDTTTYAFVKSWKTDSLYSIYPSSAPHTHIDTLLTFKSGDTSLFYYHGQKLYVYYAKYSLYSLNDSSQSYLGCYISSGCFDTGSTYSMCQVLPYRYWSASYNSWKTQFNEIILSKVYPHFDTSMGSYYAHTF